MEGTKSLSRDEILCGLEILQSDYHMHFEVIDKIEAKLIVKVVVDVNGNLIDLLDIIRSERRYVNPR